MNSAAMIDPQSAKDLNLVHGSPSFAIRHARNGEVEVIQPAVIPDDGCIYTVAGTSLLPDNSQIPSVFVIENGGGNLVKVYWQIKGNWYEPVDDQVPQLLEMERDDLSQFDWSYALPVANDAFHA